MYLFSFKLLLLVYFCSCTSAGGRLSHNFFLTSALDAVTPNYKWVPHLDAVMHRQKEAWCNNAETDGLKICCLYYILCKVGRLASSAIPLELFVFCRLASCSLEFPASPLIIRILFCLLSHRKVMFLSITSRTLNICVLCSDWTFCVYCDLHDKWRSFMGKTLKDFSL